MQGMVLRATTSTASGPVIPPDEIVSNDPPYVINYVNTNPQSVTTSGTDSDVLIQGPVMADAESTVSTDGLVTITETYLVEVVDPVEASAESTVGTAPQVVTTSASDSDVLIQVPVTADAESAVATDGLVAITETNLVTIT